MFATKKRHRINATRSSQSPSNSRILSRQKAHQTAIRNILYSNGGQAGLTKELPNGHFDEGADRVPGQGIAIPDPMRLNRIQRKEPVQTRSYADRGETHIQMQEEPRDEEEETLQAKSMSGQVPQVDSDIESKINNLKGTGRPLESTTRAYFEPVRFGYIRMMPLEISPNPSMLELLHMATMW